MSKFWPGLLLALLSLSGAAAQGRATSPDTLAPPSRLRHDSRPGPRRLRGTIGKRAITMELDSVGGSYLGGYYYQRQGRWLEVRPAAPPDSLAPRETAAADAAGRFQLKALPAGRLSGTWRSGAGGPALPVGLRETYAGAARYQQDVWELTRYATRRPGALDSAFFHQQYVQVQLPRNPAAQQRLRRALAAPYPPEGMPSYLDTLLRGRQQYAGYQFHAFSDVVYNSLYLFSVVRVTAVQQGPDYQPHEWYDGATYNLYSGRRLQLSDLLEPGYQPRLLALFRRRLQQAWESNPAYGPLGALARPLPVGGFVVTSTGLSFTYDDRDDDRLASPGEAPADRALEVELTYKELLPLIRLDGPLEPVLRERGLLPDE